MVTLCYSGGRQGVQMANGGCDTRGSDMVAGGIKVASEQIGSQWWMNTGYAGPEPDLATKAKFSDATVANAWANTYLAQAKVNSDMGVQQAAGKWLGDPAQNPSGINLWANAPSVYQQQFALAATTPSQANTMNADTGITAQTAKNLQKLTDALDSGSYYSGEPNVPVVQGAGGYSFGTPGTSDTTSSGTGILSSLGLGALLVIGALVIAVFWLFSRTGSSRGSAHGA